MSKTHLISTDFCVSKQKTIFQMTNSGSFVPKWSILEIIDPWSMCSTHYGLLVYDYAYLGMPYATHTPQ